jgi:hypothetical protein
MPTAYENAKMQFENLSNLKKKNVKLIINCYTRLSLQHPVIAGFDPQSHFCNIEIAGRCPQ